MLHYISKKILNLFFPFQCPICNTIVNKSNICDICWKQLIFIQQPFCSKCHHPFEVESNKSTLCINCITNKIYFKKSTSILIYNKTSGTLISKLKYKDQTNIAKFAAKLMSEHSQDFLKENNIDLIVSIPMHKKKLQQRKYNQSALLAKKLAQLNNIEFILDFLIKTKNTKPQTTLKQKDRKTNLQNTFSLNLKYSLKNFRNKNILLIDDVFTTGSTLNECAKILVKNEIKNIYCLTLAKTKK